MITSIDIRDDLWQKAKILAIKEKSDLKSIVNEALKEYLQRRAKKGGDPNRQE
jgi:predicted transcriptional regulator